MIHKLPDNSGDNLINAAVEFGALRHKGQTRKTGEPYFDHCLEEESLREALQSDGRFSECLVV